MDAPRDAFPARLPPSSPPPSDRQHLRRSPALIVRRDDVQDSDRFSSPSPSPRRDVMRTSVAAALNGRPSPASGSRCGSPPSILGTDGIGFAADAARFPAVSNSLVDRFLRLHVDGGNGIEPAGSSSGGGCTNTGVGGTLPVEVLGTRGRSLGPRPALLDDPNFATNSVLDGYGRVREEEPKGAAPAPRGSALEEYVFLGKNAQWQRATWREVRVARQRVTDGIAFPSADGFSAHGRGDLLKEHQTSFGNSYSRGTRGNNGMVSHSDFLQWQQGRIDLGHRLGLPSAQTSTQARSPDLPGWNEQGGAHCDCGHQSLASARNMRKSEPYGESLILRECTLNFAQTFPHMPPSGLPIYNQQNNGQSDRGLRSLASARNMSNRDPYGCGDSLRFRSLDCSLPLPSGQLNSQLDPGTVFRSSARNIRRNSELLTNGKPPCFYVCSRQVHQRDNRTLTRRNHNSGIGQLHSPDNYSLSSPSLNLNNVYIHNLAKEQTWCLCLQQMLDKGRSEIIVCIYNGVIHHIVDLMMDPSGNFLIQKLLDICNEDQRLGIILVVTENPVQFVKTCLNPHGLITMMTIQLPNASGQEVQKLIDTLKTQQQIEYMVSALKQGLLELTRDINGNHVIQRCLLSLQQEHKKFIIDAASEYCIDLATHRHGCCVLQHCIYFSTGECQEKLVAQISANAYLLARDAFGNYLVQYILDLGSPLAIANVMSQFQGNYVTLSTQKFSSNVVEKCLMVFSEGHRANIVYELLSVPRFEQLLQDPYANYVIKTALESTKGSVKAALVEAVLPHARALRTSPHCRQIFSIVKM